MTLAFKFAVIATARFICLATTPVAARTLDRRAAVRLALAQNPQIAAARAEEAVLQAQRRQADAALRPQITLDSGVATSLKATLVPGTADQSVESQYRNLHLGDVSAAFLGNLAVVQPLYTFGKIAFRQQAATYGLRARQAETRMRRADVAFEVARIYESSLLARDVERFMDETIHWLDSTLQAAQARVASSNGNTTERDVLRLQTALGLAQVALDEARAGRAQATAGLTAYLGLPPDEELTPAEPELMPVGQTPVDMKALVSLARDSRPEFAALREGQRALDTLARAEAAGWAPDLFLMGLVSAAYTPGRDWIQTRFVVDPLNHVVPGVMIGLHWQLQGGMASARAQEQRARADVLVHLGDWAGLGVPAEVRRAYEDILRTNGDMVASAAAIKHAKQWMVQASADYTVGFLDVREVSDAVTAYVTLRTAGMKARFDHNVAMAALAKATGTLDGDSQLFYLAPDAAPSAEVQP